MGPVYPVYEAIAAGQMYNLLYSNIDMAIKQWVCNMYYLLSLEIFINIKGNIIWNLAEVRALWGHFL